MTGDITIIIGFLNTLNLVARYDLFASTDTVEAWAARTCRAGEPLTVSLPDAAWLIDFREAVRGLAAGNSGATPDAAAVEIMNRASGIAELRFGFSQEGPAELTSSASGIESIVAGVLKAMYRAMSDGSWSRLKVCRNPDCRWAFYDRSKNHSRVWCEMKECGNKMKARRFRQRIRAARQGGQDVSGEQ